jgi:hypothetical protein
VCSGLGDDHESETDGRNDPSQACRSSQSEESWQKSAGGGGGLPSTVCLWKYLSLVLKSSSMQQKGEQQATALLENLCLFIIWCQLEHFKLPKSGTCVTSLRSRLPANCFFVYSLRSMNTLLALTTKRVRDSRRCNVTNNVLRFG